MVRLLVCHGSYPCGHSQTVLLVRVHSFFFIFPFLHNWQLSQASRDVCALNVTPFQQSLHCPAEVRSPALLYPQLRVNCFPGPQGGHSTQPVPFLKYLLLLHEPQVACHKQTRERWSTTNLYTKYRYKFKAGVNMKAVFWLGMTFLTQISQRISKIYGKGNFEDLVLF